MVTDHILLIMAQITNKTVRFYLTLHSPSEEASFSTPAPLFLVSSLPSLEITETVVPVSQICCSMFLFLSIYLESSPLSRIVNGPQAKQEVFFLLIGRVPTVCGSVLSAGWLCGSTKRMTERERKNAGRPLSTPSAPRPVVSAHQLWPKCLCVQSTDLSVTQDSRFLFEPLFAVLCL